MKLILTRHGQTLANTSGMTMGQLDSPLTAIGLKQAMQKGTQLAKMKVAKIYSSDLGRCRKTAEEIQKHLMAAPSITLSKKLREINFGIYQGKPYTDVPTIEGGYMRQPFPDGESNEMMIRRVINEVNKIYMANKDQTVLIVTHSGPIASIVAACSSAAFADTLERKVSNSDVIELLIDRPLKYPSLN